MKLAEIERTLQTESRTTWTQSVETGEHLKGHVRTRVTDGSKEVTCDACASKLHSFKPHRIEEHDGAGDISAICRPIHRQTHK